MTITFLSILVVVIITVPAADDTPEIVKITTTGEPSTTSQCALNYGRFHKKIVAECKAALVEVHSTPPGGFSTLSLSYLSSDVMELTFNSSIEPTGSMYQKKNRRDRLIYEAVITSSPDTKNKFGFFKDYKKDVTYMLENCGRGYELCKVFFGVDHVPTSPPPTSPPDVNQVVDNDAGKIDPAGNDLDSGREIPGTGETDDEITKVNVAIYYHWNTTGYGTKQDMDGFVDLMLAVANAGYRNSNVPIRLVKFIVEQVGEQCKVGKDTEKCKKLSGSNKYFSENRKFFSEPASDILQKFKRLKGENISCRLRRTADAAILLLPSTFGKHSSVVAGYSRCGVNHIRTGRTFSIVSKSYAISNMMLGHQLGRNFGLCGEGIESAPGTIMEDTLHGRRNFYSDPHAQSLREKSAAISTIGDETGVCNTSTTNTGLQEVVCIKNKYLPNTCSKRHYVYIVFGGITDKEEHLTAVSELKAAVLKEMEMLYNLTVSVTIFAKRNRKLKKVYSATLNDDVDELANTMQGLNLAKIPHRKRKLDLEKTNILEEKFVEQSSIVINLIGRFKKMRRFKEKCQEKRIVFKKIGINAINNTLWLRS